MEKDYNRNTYVLQDDDSKGTVQIADDVVAVIAGLAATEVKGVAAMAGNITNEIVKYVNEHYMEQLTLDVIAKNMYVNYHHASKIFKKITGKSFLNYLNSIRIEKAKELCVTTRKKDYEIAKIVGIEDAYYFSRLFKRYVGMSVSEYRKKLIKTDEEEN